MIHLKNYFSSTGLSIYGSIIAPANQKMFFSIVSCLLSHYFDLWNLLSFCHIFIFLVFTPFCCFYFIQAIFWLVVPKLIREEEIKLIMSILFMMFLFQFLPKVYHSICVMRRIQKVTGYIFGTIWWGFALNLIAYFIASHVSACCIRLFRYFSW